MTKKEMKKKKRQKFLQKKKNINNNVSKKVPNRYSRLKVVPKNNLSPTQQLYKYLLTESPYSDFWSDYFVRSKFVIKENSWGLLIHSPFFVSEFHKEHEEFHVQGIKTRENKFRETQDIWLVERAYRPQFLLSFIKQNVETLSKEDINELIIDLWQDTEMPSSAKEFWDEIFTYLTPSLLDRSELPEGQFKIYRGGHESGRSWSLNKETGEWFANRFRLSHEDYLFNERTITADDVLFYTNDRCEYEVVLKDSALFTQLDECA